MQEGNEARCVGRSRHADGREACAFVLQSKAGLWAGGEAGGGGAARGEAKRRAQGHGRSTHPGLAAEAAPADAADAAAEQHAADYAHQQEDAPVVCGDTGRERANMADEAEAEPQWAGLFPGIELRSGVPGPGGDSGGVSGRGGGGSGGGAGGELGGGGGGGAPGGGKEGGGVPGGGREGVGTPGGVSGEGAAGVGAIGGGVEGPGGRAGDGSPGGGEGGGGEGAGTMRRETLAPQRQKTSYSQSSGVELNCEAPAQSGGRRAWRG